MTKIQQAQERAAMICESYAEKQTKYSRAEHVSQFLGAAINETEKS
jgi:protein-arginine kinase activator protein McsA